MPRQVGRLIAALGEVTDATQVTRERAEDALRTCNELAEASDSLRFVVQANTQILVDVATPLSTTAGQEVSWIVAAATPVENANVVADAQSAVTHASQALDGLAQVADRAVAAYLRSKSAISELLTWLEEIDEAVQSADGIRDRSLYGAQQVACALVERLDYRLMLPPELLRRAAVVGARGIPADSADGALRGACAQLAAVLVRAKDEARDLDREVEFIIKDVNRS